MAGDGSDYILSDWGGHDDINEAKNHFEGAGAPADPATGCLWYDSGNSKLKIWDGSAWTVIGSATGNLLPVGSIIQYIPGYFADGSNGVYTNVLPTADTIAAVNTLQNPGGWYVCDGAQLTLADSPIYNTADPILDPRFLPNLTDDRFIMGDTAIGALGGSNTQAHTHAFDVAAKNTGAEDNTVTLTFAVAQDVAEFTHLHSCDPPSTTSGPASNDENRPLFLACFYLHRAI
jgi:hypothetical protein